MTVPPEELSKRLTDLINNPLDTNSRYVLCRQAAEHIEDLEEGLEAAQDQLEKFRYFAREAINILGDDLSVKQDLLNFAQEEGYIQITSMGIQRTEKLAGDE